ncbi:efflux RND transporter periplasmic adaptor subunit [Corallococcus exiguus]|uniref:efflux RND transporter periplasmic adaptor subunit n=1 Tax=Corallococcus TaxID=83461 RepID=UPI000ECD066E|nr:MULTISPECIES: efflux RND transporter periplasmic adaptor subunit [Corallococcus]NNC14749.1 efflux RND transporter periplasmic adaptor subunit [Corallococcus exiguus]NRD64326.1 efflux RND transporter periplasmic adaptor subunit [Corallococcus exiguus]RKI14954.1 efflux RND transporter periplasmic adaptor subunit [Corallococcus sp. AB030]
MRLVRGGWGAWGLVLALSAGGCSGGKDPGQAAPGGGPQAGSQTQGGGKPTPVQVMAVKPGPVRDTREYVGTLISRSSITVVPQVAGYIQKIPVRQGQKVKAGQVLLVVDPRQEQASLRATQAQKASAVANREFARRTRERSAQLLREGLVSRQDYDQAVAQAAQSEAQAQAAEAQIQNQQVQLGFFNVSAPFDGVVGDIPVKLGDYVTPQTALTILDQSRALELSVQVPVDQAARVKIGETPLEVLNEDGEPIVRAPAFFVATTPNPNTQLVEVQAAFENTVGLRAGQLVRAQLVYDVRDALKMPTTAVTRQGSQSFAMVVGEGDAGTVVKRQPVTLGLVEGNDYEVLKGLDAGTQVIISGVQQLRDGMPIQPKPAQQSQGQTAGMPLPPAQGMGGGSDAGQ